MAESKRALIGALESLFRRGTEMLGSEKTDSARHRAWVQTVNATLSEAWPNRKYALSWPSSRMNANPDEYTQKALREHIAYLQEILSHETRPEADSQGETVRVPADLLDAFVSHSSRDQQLADACLKLLRAAIHIPGEMIRCTSVPGYKLKAGSDYETQLRAETNRSTCFIALITPNSLNSDFTKFEVAARWGSERGMFPILACGATAEDVSRPLSSIHLINGTRKDEVIDFVGDVAAKLGRPMESSSVWLAELEEFVALASQIVAAQLKTVDVPGNAVIHETTLALSEQAKQMLVGASQGGGIITRISNMRTLKIRAGTFETEVVGKGPERAAWEDGIRQLISGRFVEETSKGVFELLKNGYDEAARQV